MFQRRQFTQMVRAKIQRAAGREWGNVTVSCKLIWKDDIVCVLTRICWNLSRLIYSMRKFSGIHSLIIYLMTVLPIVETFALKVRVSQNYVMSMCTNHLQIMLPLSHSHMICVSCNTNDDYLWFLSFAIRYSQIFRFFILG